MRKRVVTGKHYKVRPVKVETPSNIPDLKYWEKTTIYGMDVYTRKGHRQTSVDEFIKYNKDVVMNWVRGQEKRLNRPIPNVRRYVSQYLKSFNYNFIEFVKKAAAPIEIRQAAYAYELLVETGKIEDLQAEVNEEVELSRIHYLGSNLYEYIGTTRKCRFEISYYKGGNSYVDVEIFTGVDI